MLEPVSVITSIVKFVVYVGGAVATYYGVEYIFAMIG